MNRLNDKLLSMWQSAERCFGAYHSAIEEESTAEELDGQIWSRTLASVTTVVSRLQSERKAIASQLVQQQHLWDQALSEGRKAEYQKQRLQEELDRAKQKLEAMKGQGEEEATRLSRDNATIAELKDEFKSVMGNIRVMKQQIEEMKKQRSDLETHATDLQRACNDAKADMALEELRLAELKEAVNCKRLESGVLAKQWDELKATVATLQQQYSNAKRDNDELEQQCQEQRLAVNACKDSCERLTATMKKEKSKTEALKEQRSGWRSTMPSRQPARVRRIPQELYSVRNVSMYTGSPSGSTEGSEAISTPDFETSPTTDCSSVLEWDMFSDNLNLRQAI